VRHARIEVDGRAQHATLGDDDRTLKLDDGRTLPASEARWLPAVEAPSKIVATHLSYRSSTR
jgi:hypothetical protein